MFDGERKRPAKAKPGPLKRSGAVRQVSGNIVVSCYIASALIAVVAVSEAMRCFGSGNKSGGAFYVILAVLGALFSVFITVMNNRNKKRLGQTKKFKKK